MTSSIDELATLSETELLDRLGRELYGAGALGVGTADRGRYRRLARQWLLDQAEMFRAKLCGNGGMLHIVEGRSGDLVTDLAIVSDALSGALGKPTANIVAVILLRRGLASLCSDH